MFLRKQANIEQISFFFFLKGRGLYLQRSPFYRVDIYNTDTQALNDPTRASHNDEKVQFLGSFLLSSLSQYRMDLAPHY